MKRIVTKGLNFTEMRIHGKDAFQETVMVWILPRNRKPEDCGVWQDGEKVKGFEEMKQK